MNSLAERPGFWSRSRTALNPRNWPGAFSGLMGKYADVPPPVLPQYVPLRVPIRDKTRKLFWLSLIVLVGMIYGFLVAIFPMAFYQYLAMPIAVIALLVIWVLPDTDNPPIGAVKWLFWAAFFALFLWPNYLAISLPGLPWITMVRLWNGPMVLLLLISLAISPSLRAQLKTTFADSPLISWLVLAFMVLQVVTIGFSGHLGDTSNRAISNILEWGVVFVVASLVFTTVGQADRWVRALCLMAMFLAFLSFFEWTEKKVLWADHIPSFLVVADESVQRTLAGYARAATGIYRLQSVFTTPLNFAEFLGLSTAFFIHAIVTSRNNFARFALIAYIPWHFWTIWCTDSRLGMVGFFGSFLLYPLIWGIRRWQARSRDILAPALVLAYPAIISAFFVTSLFWQRLNRMIWGGGEQKSSNDARAEQWDTLWPKLGQWPLGHGPGQSGDALGYTNSDGVITVDSYYITVLMDYGVIGFFIYYGLIISAAYQAYKFSLQAKDQESTYLFPAAIMLIMFIVIKGVLSQEDSHAMIFMILGMIVALTHRMKQEHLAKQA